jgi:adenylate cyclase class IV
MEVEIKLRLPDGPTHEKVASLLGPKHEVTYLQENVFFDGAAQELSSKRTVLRLRFYNGDERCVATVKGKAVIIDGISRGTEVRE